jgi:PAS domain S-box-containing protein
LVEPSRLVTARADQRTARLLASILVVLAPLALLSIILQVADGEFDVGPQAVVGGAVVAILVAYALSRTRHFRIAGAMTTLLPTVGGIAVLIADTDDPAWFAFMALNPALGTLLLEIGWSTALALVNLAAVVIAVLTEPSLDGDTAAVAVMFNAIAAAVLLTGAAFRDRQEHDRRADLLARQRLHERILEGTFGGIAIVRDGVVAETNAAFAELVGATQDEVAGTALVSLFDEDVSDVLARAIATPGPRPAELALVRRDGSTLRAEVLVRGADDGGGASVVVAMRDVTERHRAAEMLQRAEQMESLGRLAASIVHDTNNELFIVTADADRLIAEQEAAGRPTDAAHRILDATARISTMLRRVLVLGRDETIQPEPIDVPRFVDERRRMWQQVLGHDIQLDGIDRGAGVAWSDRSRLEQLLLNLVLNARDAIDGPGVVRLETDEISIDERAANGDLPTGPYQRIVVADDGRGIAARDLERVFEPFFTTKADGLGTGLGLYTSRQIAEQAGGSLTVESGPGGTTFTVLLPAAPRPTPS